MIKSLLVGMYVLSLEVCPDPSALETFKHQIAYEMTEELRPFEGLVSMHTDVWMQGPITVFYVRDQARGFAPNERPLYMFNPHGRNGGAICSANDPLQICLQKSLDIKTVETTAQTCTATTIFVLYVGRPL